MFECRFKSGIANINQNNDYGGGGGTEGKWKQ